MEKKMKLTKYEKNLEKSFKHGEWQSVDMSEVENMIQMAKKQIASSNKDKQVNIRMNEAVIELAKKKALEEGLPGYQTLMYSVIFKYLTGRLVDIDSAKILIRQNK